ncbi:unnamed protein product, partial [Vitis vinifera]|uniref:Kinesin motor domain-containing protein n=1 Tax=Vitis vinifera TaxID=29760 RepID=D7TPP7_VITVI
MLRDLKFFRRNSAKNPVEEIENVPVNPTDLSAMQTGVDAMRPPLTTIPDSTQTSKPFVEPESGFRNKVDRTPTKAKGKSSDTALPGRTPDKQGIGLSGRNRFGWAQKNEPNSVVPESRDDGSQMSRGAGFGNGGTLNYSECNSTQSTPTKSVTKPPNPGLRSKIDGNGSNRSGNFAQLYKGIPVSCGPSTVVNTVEVPHFDLREDPSFWMDHNVQVLIRVRPPNSIERSMHGYNRCLKQESAQSITWIGQPEMRFTFDHVACETIDQETLFRMAGLPMVENCLSGYNSCMFAYGQTGSGKTHTMLGEIEELEVNPSPNRGMTPRIFEFLFARIRAEEESRRDERLKYFCKCSFLEIYNEQITDLLDPSSTNLLLREDIMKGVYVENLSEFEVQTVGDILRLLIQGSSNRKVAATNMNRESSRSHSVFTCVIESRWEKDSTTNLRFARLNLVDLAGSERQKTSGAEGERLKEAANINKSLSTLGHVIMVLLDVAHGKPRHVPYRDSRLTFLLQDSLGGNSKTMIIANVSPSICCSAETLNTLKFAQRAKLIQNNAVVNEDSSRDVVALQHEIRLLKVNVSRSLSFGSTTVGDTTHIQGNASTEKFPEDQQKVDDKCIVRMSSKQVCQTFKALETTLSGALRREQMAETSIKQLEAEIEQLNRLVRQREEDTRCTKMMLRFREEKIQRMESLLSGLIPADTYLLQENSALSEEILLLQAKVDRNPEVTRFALENIRLLDQLRRFQDFYEEGERDMLLTEVSELRHQLLQFLDGNSKPHNHPNFNSLPQEVICVSKENDSLHLELKHTANELEECRRNLNSCLEDNAKLSREIDNLHSMLNNLQSAPHESSVEDLSFEAYSLKAVKKEREEEKKEDLLKHTEELLHLQLELDVLKIILKEERSSRCEIEARALGLNRELELARQKVFSISKQCEEAKDELKDAKSVIEALESQQILSINEMENLRDSKSHYMELLSKQELEIFSLKEQLCCHELRDHPPSNHSESEDSPLQAKLKRMQNSLEKARRLNMWYQSDRAFQISNEEEMDEVHRQAEAETAAVIICLQEELTSLQQQVQDSNLKEIETKKNMMLLETEAKVLEEKLYHVTQDNKILGEKLEEKDEELRILSEEWEHLTCEIEEVLTNGHDALTDASHQVDLISSSFPHKRSWISEQVGRMIRIISEKELFIEELNRCLEDANNRRSDMENMLRSLKGAAMVITEAHQQECDAKEREILLLKSQLSEMNLNHVSALKQKNIQLSESEGMNLRKDDLLQDQESCGKLKVKLSEEKKRASVLEQKLEDIEEKEILTTQEKLAELQSGVSTLMSCMDDYADRVGNTEPDEETNNIDVHSVADLKTDSSQCSFKFGKSVYHNDKKILDSRPCKDVHARDITIILLKKEIESALESLKGVQAEMAKLRVEKEEIWISEKQSRENMKCLMDQVLLLQSAMRNFEEQSGLKMVVFNDKIRKSLELEVGDAKIVAAQKTAEASCFLSKFEEAQDTMKEADIMINGLMIANETMKLEIERLKKERGSLISEVASNLTETRSMVLEMEGIFAEVHTTFNEDFMAIAHDFHSMKSQLLQCTRLIRSWLEDIWSELVVKDCAVSVLDLCHMGILLETVMGLNAENGLLHHGLCESNSVIAGLREHNFKTRQELEMCRILKGKLLADIKNSFDRISRKEEETGELRIKLTAFEKKILDLQLQEESMLHRSNYMGSELAVLMKELDLSNSNILASLLDQQKLLQDKDEVIKSQAESFMIDLYSKDIDELMEAKMRLMIQVQELEAEYRKVQEDLKIKETALECSSSQISVLDQQNQKLQNDISLLETSSCNLQEALDIKDAEISKMNLLEEENKLLKTEVMKLKTECCNVLQDLEERKSEFESIDMENHRLQDRVCSLETSIASLQTDLNMKNVELNELQLSQSVIKEDIGLKIQDLQTHVNQVHTLEEENIFLKGKLSSQEKIQYEILQMSSLKMVKKDDVLKGLLFDLSLLQESASNSKDQKDEIEELAASLESLEQELAGRESLKVLSLENQELRAYVEDALAAKSSIEEELTERRKVIDSLEADIFEMSNALGQMNDSIDSLKSNLSELTNERDHLQVEVLTLKEKLEKAQACADENEAIATEAQQIAESRKTYAEDKEEEVRLLERSVEELERTVNVLENKVDIVKGEAERQRLQREELELELHALKHQMQNVESSDADMKRHLDEKEKALQEASEHIKVLERDIANRVAEIAQLKAHISELNLHAEAQASEYKQKFKALEAMVEQVKPEGFSTHVQNSSSNKSEKNASKSRGSGSPFKCIGLGLVQQIKLEKDEELFAGRLRIEELEALAASRQKEIFALNARLAATESMTHDVIRDLLGLKLDMTKYTSVLDNQQVQKITEKAQLHSIESQAKEQEVIKLKQQLNEFVEERQGWLEEIDRKQAEMVAAQIALEKLRQRDQLLKTENEMLKLENVKHKKKVMELEGEVKKLSGQQNLQQRIHHHAKIKAKNNLLKIENEDLSNKLRRAEVILSRVKEELARYRASCGRSIDFNEEQMLSNKLKETEEERLQLAQKFLNLCTSILKVAGITKPVSEISLSVAEEALEQLKNRLTTLERESQDLKFKNKIVNERIRLSELVPQPSPLSSRTDENHLTPQRGFAIDALEKLLFFPFLPFFSLPHTQRHHWNKPQFHISSILFFEF